jgi:hypothetical protein
MDDASGAFTVTLNEDGTRLLRAFRDDSASAVAPEGGDASPPRRADITTTELRIPKQEDE